MLKLREFAELDKLKRLLEKPVLYSEPRSVKKSGGYPDLHTELPKSKMISGAYSATPYVQERKTDGGEYVGIRYSPHPRARVWTKKQYSCK